MTKATRDYQIHDLSGGIAPSNFQTEGFSVQKAAIGADTFNIYSYAVDVSTRKWVMDKLNHY